MIQQGQPIQTTGNNLVGLWRPSFVKVDHRLYVYGGGGNVTNDLHVLNLCDLRWETIHVKKTVSSFFSLLHIFIKLPCWTDFYL
ncbi:hypothetical protein DM01DRAFT_1027456 [Hesseltinella vesiculosa]|uniref:Galactose oxidase n=1 Tax=Hesseltinella vesiculosa TaxID=101127 RepID=A0A1X2GKL1_9FUNG|nr:hypothetical protein DM01DRAFT_1027456 [Hesseltinella vesiculosa]